MRWILLLPLHQNGNMRIAQGCGRALWSVDTIQLDGFH